MRARVRQQGVVDESCRGSEAEGMADTAAGVGCCMPQQSKSRLDSSVCCLL